MRYPPSSNFLADRLGQGSVNWLWGSPASSRPSFTHPLRLHHPASRYLQAAGDSRARALRLLPMVRNTYAGLRHIPPESRELAEAIGLPPGARLRLIELPLASREILSRIKTSVVINVCTATLEALIGEGGIRAPIMSQNCTPIHIVVNVRPRVHLYCGGSLKMMKWIKTSGQFLTGLQNLILPSGAFIRCPLFEASASLAPQTL